MRRILFIVILSLLTAVASTDDAYAQRKAARKNRGINTVKKEQTDTRKAIRQTAKQLEANKRSTLISLNRLDALNAEITTHTATISRLTAQIDSIDAYIKILIDSVAEIETSIARMRDSYTKMVRSINDRQRGAYSPLAFIFSAESVTQAYRRMRYLREVSVWRQRRSNELSAEADSLTLRKNHLAAIQQEKASALAELTTATHELKTKQNETAGIVERLKKENSTLRQVLKEKEARAKALDNELDRLIAEEQRRQEAEQRKKEEEEQQRLAEQKRRQKADQKSSDKTVTSEKKNTPVPTTTVKTPTKEQPRTYATADDTRKLGGSFESNKGQLMFPVSGKYKIVRPFGRQQHPSLPHVITDNAGIDIEVPAGGAARAVFPGKVSAIFRQPGYNTIVMVRHGQYLTVYAGLTDISVKNGQNLEQGQHIGTVFADPDDEGRAVLHFELRHEKEKLNPAQWVR